LERVVQPLTDVRDISKLAYGFMATQALVAALDLNLFGLLRDGPATSGALADRTGVRADRLEMLLTALVALGLLTKAGESYENAPAYCQKLWMTRAVNLLRRRVTRLSPSPRYRRWPALAPPLGFSGR
jgi:hypothetical protein